MAVYAGKAPAEANRMLAAVKATGKFPGANIRRMRTGFNGIANPFEGLKGVIMEDDKLAIEESRRAGQHGSVKAQVEGEVQAEIAERAAVAPPREAERIDQVAGDFRSKAVNEVVQTEREVGRGRVAARVSQVIDYLFFVLYALLALRFLLALLAAKSSAGFVQFIVAVTGPFYEPFRGIVASPQTDGGHTLMMPLVIAIIVYILLHLAINGILRMVAHGRQV